MSTTLITITGNLTDDAEVRTTTTGKATARLRVAVNRRRRDAAGTWTEQADFHTVVVWGTLAEAAADLRKGSAVIVHGRLAQRDWTTTAGEKKTVWELTAEHIGLTLRPAQATELAGPAPAQQVRHRGCSVADAHRDQRWRRRPGERGLFRAR
jgi:single-strand DNA-binding protein